MSNVPDGSNFHGSLHTALPAQRVADLLRSLGFSVRRCSWADFEIVCDWAELVVEASSPILLHGSVSDVVTNAERILARLRVAGIEYRAECCDDSGGLLRELRWSAPPG